MALKIMQAILKWTDNERLPFIAPMETDDFAKKIGSQIRIARKQRGLVMKDVADAIGVTTGAVGNWERGANVLSMENLQAVARYLELDPVALSRGEIKNLTDTELLSDAEIISDPGPAPRGPMDIEVLGVAVGGDDGDFSLNGEVAGYVRRPPGIAHLRKVFALHILSDSMVPRYDPGEMIYCGGRDPVPGDHIVIEMFPEEGQRIGKAYVKKLVKRTTTQLICAQYNPAKELTFDPYAVKAVWRIIPLHELLGY